MTQPERVIQNLNRGLHAALSCDPRIHLVGEDVADPYGGAFKATKGLSTRFPDQVLASPISEGGIVGLGAGLALAGDTAIVEIMFSDFVALAFDQILNFASKSVSMFGSRVPMNLVVRCPSGGNRGYGPTHSQSLQKHFIGIPGLNLFEMSPFHDNSERLALMTSLGQPCMSFEDKVLYTRHMFTDGVVDDVFRYDFLGDAAHVFAVPDTDPDWVVIAPGGITHRALDAMRSLLLREEVVCELLVPSQLYPFDLTPLLPLLRRAGRICVVEDGAAGGSWGELVAHSVDRALWGELGQPVTVVSALPSIIPSAAHLERRVIPQETTIRTALLEAPA